MGFSIQWDDVPELADSNDYVNRCALDFVSKRTAQALNAGDGSVSKKYEQYEAKSLSHIFIHGDNYPCLKLLKKEYAEKIDLIYIDPPYNTGKTSFIYDDARFSTGKSFDRSFDRHSAWLSFMQRRLLAAKDLLSDTGCIFIAIGNEELYQLKLLCDQIFGEDNFINDFMWLHGKGKKDSWSRTLEESNLCYAKNKKRLAPFEDFEVTDWATDNADGDARGNWFSGSISFSEERSSKSHPNFYQIISPSGIKWQRQWFLPKNQMDNLLANNMIYFGKAPDFSNVPRRKIFNGERNKIIPRNMIEFAESTRQAQSHVDELLGEKKSFDNPKSVALIRHLLQITAMKKDAIIMDFFGGSGTTFEAVLNLNKLDGGCRKCIIIQEPQKIFKKDSSFATISELCLKRMEVVLGTDDEILEYRLSVK